MLRAEITGEGWAAIITAGFAGLAVVLKAASELRKKAARVEANVGAPPPETPGSVWEHVTTLTIESGHLRDELEETKTELAEAARDRADLRALVDAQEARREEEAARCEARLADLSARLDAVVDRAVGAVTTAIGADNETTRAAIRRLFEQDQEG